VNAKGLRGIFEWVYVVACACRAFALDDLLYYFPQNILKTNQRNQLFQSVKSATNKKPRFIGGAAYSFWLKNSIR
jgi:hypothetical protein